MLSVKNGHGDDTLDALSSAERIFITGDHSVWRGPSSHSERPVRSEVQHTGPIPMDRFSHRESGLHCTLAAWWVAR